MTQFLLDTFTDTTGTLLHNHTADSGATWVQHPAASGEFVISNGYARCSAAGVVYASAVPPSPDYEVEAPYRYLTSQGSLGLVTRLATDAATFYLARHTLDKWDIYRFIGGAASLLTSSPHVLTVGATYQVVFRVKGTTQTIFVDGAQVAQASDTTPALQGAGRIGLRDTAFTSDTIGRHLDSIHATTLATRRIFPVLKVGSQHIGPLRAGKA